jgi:hypothetical protein
MPNNSFNQTLDRMAFILTFRVKSRHPHASDSLRPLPPPHPRRLRPHQADVSQLPRRALETLHAQVRHSECLLDRLGLLLVWDVPRTRPPLIDPLLHPALLLPLLILLGLLPGLAVQARHRLLCPFELHHVRVRHLVDHDVLGRAPRLPFFY